MKNRLRSFVHTAIGDAQRAAADYPRGIVPAIISTSNVARDQAIIEASGWDFANYMRNPVVLWTHDDGASETFAGHGSGLPIARSDQPEIYGDIVTAVANFDLEDEVASRILGKIARGFLHATSVRWIPLEYRIDRRAGADGVETNVIVYVRSEMLEWSFVAVPSDPGAMITRADGSPIDIADYMTPPSNLERVDLNPFSLVDIVGAAHALVEGRSEGVFTPDEVEAADRLHGALTSRVLTLPRALPSSATGEIERALETVTGVLEDVARGLGDLTAPVLDVRLEVASAIAAATGRSVQTVLSMMEG